MEEDDKIYILTKFEIARIIGQRSEQIASGAQPCCDVSDCKSSMQIAEKEFMSGYTPVAIDRRLPNGRVVVITNKNSKF